MSRLQSLFRRRHIEAEMTTELRTHLDLATEAKIAAGMSPADARRAAALECGGLDQARESYRDARFFVWLENLLRDFRHAARSLVKSPGFTATVVLSLALGIGASSAIFSIVNGVLLSSLPVPNPHDLRTVEWSGIDAEIQNYTGSRTVQNRLNPGSGPSVANAFNHPAFNALRANCAGVADVFGYATASSINVRARREAFTSPGLVVSDNFFSGLKVRPFLGRIFDASDAKPDATPAIVITHNWWIWHFDSDPNVIGQTVTLNSQPFTIIGVLQPGMTGVSPGAQSYFFVLLNAAPLLQRNSYVLNSPNHWWVRLMARLKPDVPEARFNSVAQVVFSQQCEGVMKSPQLRILPGHAGPPSATDSYRSRLVTLLIIVGIVNLIVCANVTGLSLARGAARRHEKAVRAALGAGRWQLIRSSLVESFLLTATSTAAGMAISVWARSGLSVLIAGDSEGLSYDTSMDFRVFLFAVALALITTLLAGLLPALQAAHADPISSLKAQASRGLSRIRFSNALVAIQIALSLLLVAGAGLCTKSLISLARIDTGFSMENLLLFRIHPRNAGYKGPVKIASVYEQVQTRLATIPGVKSASVLQEAHLSNSCSSTSVGMQGIPATRNSGLDVITLGIGEYYFSTMGIPVLAGRSFLATDTAAGPKVVMVNEAFCQKYCKGAYPIGETIRWDNADYAIVGVCRNTKNMNLREEPSPTLYSSFRQVPMGSTYFAVRTSQTPEVILKSVREAVASIDPNLPLSQVSTQKQLYQQQTNSERTLAWLYTILSGFAVLISCIGLYGLMAYNVTRRTREIGIRMALGAPSPSVASSILREALLIVITGLGIGIPVALGAGRFISSSLYGVQPHDPLVLGLASLLFITIALLAALHPARRAMRINPVEALRSE